MNKCKYSRIPDVIPGIDRQCIHPERYWCEEHKQCHCPVCDKEADEYWKSKEKMIRVIVAGKFDPLHDGHKSHFREAAKLGDKLIVITHPNYIVASHSDKGFCYQTLQIRIQEILKEPYVSDVFVANLDTDGTVTKTLAYLKSFFDSELIFAKGGDRTPDNMPESEIKVCEECRIRIAYGVGDEKTQSSSILVQSIPVQARPDLTSPHHPKPSQAVPIQTKPIY